MNGRDIMPFGDDKAKVVVRGQDRYFDIFDLWKLGGRPNDDRHYSLYLENANTSRRVERFKDDKRIPAIISDPTTGVTCIHEYFATEYAEDLSPALWMAVRAYLSGHGYSGPSTPALPDDPIIAMRLQQLELEKRVRSVEANQEKIAGALGSGPSHWTVTAWCSDHGVAITKDVAKAEGMRLRSICDRLGYVVPREKVCMGSDFPARRWPIEAIRQWWPDFKRRHEII